MRKSYQKRRKLMKKIKNGFATEQEKKFFKSVAKSDTSKKFAKQYC